MSKGDFDNAGGGGGGVPNCNEVPSGNPCCGDGICGGPETENNCPTDCAVTTNPPEINNFGLSADTINTLMLLQSFIIFLLQLMIIIFRVIL